MHIGFLKSILNVPTSTNTTCVLVELHQTPPSEIILERQVKYWNRLHLIDPPRLLAHACAENLSWLLTPTGRHRACWGQSLIKRLSNMGITTPRSHINTDPTMLPLDIVKLKHMDRRPAILKAALVGGYLDHRDVYLADFHQRVDGERHRTYATYFWQTCDKSRSPCHFLQRTLTQFRLGKHGLGVLHRQTPRVERAHMQCQFCLTQVIEDEYHFLLECPLYTDIRAQHPLLFEHMAPTQHPNGSIMAEGGDNICLVLRGDQTMRSLFGTPHQGDLASFITQCLKRRDRTQNRSPHP